MSADKPSEQAIHVAKVLLHLQADKPLPVERLAAIIDEQHRNARAEAFDECAKAAHRFRDDSDGDADYVVLSLIGLARKERGAQ